MSHNALRSMWRVKAKSEEEAITNLREALELYFEPPMATAAPHIRTIEIDVSAA